MKMVKRVIRWISGLAIGACILAVIINELSISLTILATIFAIGLVLWAWDEVI